MATLKDALVDAGISTTPTLSEKSHRIAVLFDVPNMYVSTQIVKNSKVNFERILSTIVGDRQLVKAIAFVSTTVSSDNHGFITVLKNAGFTPNIVTFKDKARPATVKVEITLAAIQAIPKSDVIVLVSGDKDFASLIRHIKSHGVSTEVVSFYATSGLELQEEADKFIGMDHKAKALSSKWDDCFIPIPSVPQVVTPPAQEK